jgi:hypothetical protein
MIRHIASLFHGSCLSFCQWVLVPMSPAKQRAQCSGSSELTSHDLCLESVCNFRSAGINNRNRGIRAASCHIKNGDPTLSAISIIAQWRGGLT